MRALNKQTGQLEKVYVKALDSMPVGTIVSFDGQESDIPVGWEEITDFNSYSTNEVKTNKTWIDGKPIYRKTFSFNNINIGTTDYNWTGSLNLSNISYITVDETYSYFVITGQKYPINYSQPQYNSGSSYRINVANSEPDFIFYKTNNFSVSDIVVTVEYTKTTD